MSGFNYTAGTETENDYSAIPAADYVGQIKSTEMKETRQGGKMLVLKWEILEGPCKGRFIWENLNIENSNNQAVEIARKALNSICMAVGLQGFNDPSELESKPVLLSIGVKTDSHYGDQNTFKKHTSMSGNRPATQQPAQQPAQQQTNQNDDVPAFMQKNK